MKIKTLSARNTMLLYRGPSMIDGKPIVAIGVYRTGSGVNAKTGAMLQTYILREDQSPMEAIRTGADESICGDCPHRGTPGVYGSRSCYVNIGQGPTAVYGAYLRGRYTWGQHGSFGIALRVRVGDMAHPADLMDFGNGRMVRLGTYGDPAAVPAAVWTALLMYAAGHTGYTHQWREPFAAALRPYVMASADSMADRIEANDCGWRTFRVREADEPVGPGEFVCPASAEAGKRKTCVECRACDGADRAGKASPVIIAHGALARRFAENRAAGRVSMVANG